MTRFLMALGPAGQIPDRFEPEWLRDHMPRILPPSWTLESWAMDGGRWLGPGLVVILSGQEEQDGKRWLHLSCSHVRRLPRWEELREVKDLFLGKNSLALQILPPEAEYVNIHPNVLHLWCCLDGRPTPDFTRGGKTI